MNVLLFVLALAHVIVSASLMFRKDFSGVRKIFDSVNRSIKSIPLLQLFYAEWLVSFIICLVIVLLTSMRRN